MADTQEDQTQAQADVKPAGKLSRKILFQELLW